MIRFVQFTTSTPEDQREIGARLGTLFKGEIDVAVSSKGFVFRRIGIKETLKCADLTNALAAKIRNIVHDLEQGQPSAEKLKELTEAKALLSKVVQLGSDVEASDRPSKIKRSMVKGVTKALTEVFDAKKKVVKGASKLASTVDKYLLDEHQKRKGESPAVMKANSSLRLSLESNDPYGDSFEALYTRYQTMYLSETRKEIDSLLIKKNRALDLCFSYMVNLFKGNKGEEIHSNSLLKSALENRKIEDANFIISKHLYKGITRALLDKFSAIPWMSEGDKENMLRNMFQSALNVYPQDTKGAEILLDYLFSGERVEFAKNLIVDVLDNTEASSEAKHLCRLAAARNGDPELIKEAFNPTVLESYKDWTDSKSGKTLLHYACKSNNGEFVKQVADMMGSDKLRDVFLQPDKDGELPAYSMTLSLANQLDSLYRLDGNQSGSFCSFAWYCAKVNKAVNIGVIGSTILTSRIIGNAAATAAQIYIPAGSIFLETVGMHVPNDASIISGAIAAFLLRKPVIRLALKTMWKTQLSLKQLDSPQLKTKSDPVTSMDDFKKAIKQKDVVRIADYIKNSPAEFKLSKKMMNSLVNIRFFPEKDNGIDYRKILMDKVFVDCDNPDLLEKFMDKQLESNGRDWVDSKLESIVQVVEEPQKKALFMMAVKMGRNDIIEKIAVNMTPESWLGWQNRDGETLLHLACYSKDPATILYVAARMNEQMQLNQETVQPIERSKQNIFSWSGISLVGLVTIIRGKRTFNNNVFSIQNGHGVKVQDLISRDVANSLDEILQLDPENPGSFSFLLLLKGAQESWQLTSQTMLAVPVMNVMNFLVADVMQLAIAGTFTAVLHSGGPGPAFIAATLVEFALNNSLLLVALGITHVLGKQTGDAISNFENMTRRYDNTLTQLGNNPLEASERFSTATIKPEDQVLIFSKMKPSLEKALNELFSDVSKVSKFQGSEDQLRKLQAKMMNCLAEGRHLHEVLYKLSRTTQSIVLSRDQREYFAEVMTERLTAESVFRDLLQANAET